MSTLVVVLAGVLAPPLVVMLGVALYVAFVHSTWARWYRREQRPLPLRGGALVAYWLGEIAASARVLWWRVLWVLARPRVGGAGRPVVCVHGFGGAAADMLGIVRALARSGRPAYSISMGPPLAAIEQWAAQLADRVAALLADHPEADGVDLVGHSMGGLVSRVVLDKYPELATRVRTLVMLGSPNHGTAAVRRFTPGENLAQMRRGSPFLQTLPLPRDVAPHTRVLTFGARQDYIVYPPETCELPGVPHEMVDAGHAGLVASSQVIDRVVEALAESKKTS